MCLLFWSRVFLLSIIFDVQMNVNVYFLNCEWFVVMMLFSWNIHEILCHSVFMYFPCCCSYVLMYILKYDYCLYNAICWIFCVFFEGYSNRRNAFRFLSPLDILFQGLIKVVDEEIRIFIISIFSLVFCGWVAPWMTLS